VSEARG
jgi:hypothetical protein